MAEQFWAWQPNMFNNLKASGDAHLAAGAEPAPTSARPRSRA
jgi:hypothetical protein